MDDPVLAYEDGHPIRRSEVVARKWAADAKITEHAYALVEQDDLDPTLADDVEAAIREDDHDRLLLAVTRLLEAIAEARGLD